MQIEKTQVIYQRYSTLLATTNSPPPIKLRYAATDRTAITLAIPLPALASPKSTCNPGTSTAQTVHS